MERRSGLMANPCTNTEEAKTAKLMVMISSRCATSHGSPRARASANAPLKAITYRGVIVCLDFLVIYLLTGKVMTAVAFMIVSNIYTTVAYFLHEHVWADIRWGLEPQKET